MPDRPPGRPRGPRGQPDHRPGRGVPSSTYRLQLRPGFGFRDAAGIAGYLASLGVSHVYLSPVLQAAPGSQHGYDVVDHSRLAAELGGHDGFTDMAERFHRHGLGIVVDIVPNHMAIPVPESSNAQLWSVLAEGPASAYAHWFDIDWAAQDGRLLMPVLAGAPEDCLGDLGVDRSPHDAGLPGQAPVLRYAGHVFPVRAGTEDLPLPALLDAQHYRLADWRRAASELNYRRFFDIVSLIAVRAEDPAVFTATHELVLRLLADGLIDGLRVDHPDGLADPRGYLERLAKASGGAWVVVEKILTAGEELPRDWPCAGTTGYDALGAVGGLLLDQAGEHALTHSYTDFTGGPAGFAGVAETSKRQAAQGTLAAEVARLSRSLAATGEPSVARPTWGERAPAAPAMGVLTPDQRARVLAELLAAFRVYRAYVVPGEPAPTASVEVVTRAAEAARARLPAALHGALDAVVDLALGRAIGAAQVGVQADGPHARDEAAARDEFAVRFQQTCGPVMAKGVEDTAFYRWSRLVSLNEVGGEPDDFGGGLAGFHRFAARLALDWPATMTTLSTHDTKRQEDVRARLGVLAEDPAEWAAEVTRWHERAARLVGDTLPEPDTEYLLWQTLAGAWPITGPRLAGYLTKAMREAKTRTSWASPDPAYERAVLGFAEAVLADPTLAGWVGEHVARVAPDAESNTLSAKLVQLTMPGVPDVYQGCELTALSLVDPDNRRPVDFARRAELLATLDRRDRRDRRAPAPAGPAEAAPAEAAPAEAAPAEAPGLAAGDEAKLLVTSRALRLRRAHPEWFTGTYEALSAEGPAAVHAVAFARGGAAITVATRLPRGLRRSGGWGDTVLPLPGDRWHDILTGAEVNGERPLLAALTQRLPVALLVPGPSRGA